LRVTGSLAFVAAARAAFLVTRDKDDNKRRLLLPLKNNIGPDGSGCAYRIETFKLENGIETSRVDWESESVSMTADEALQTAVKDRIQAPAREDAAEFLREVLKTGPVP